MGGSWRTEGLRKNNACCRAPPLDHSVELHIILKLYKTLVHKYIFSLNSSFKSLLCQIKCCAFTILSGAILLYVNSNWIALEPDFTLFGNIVRF